VESKISDSMVQHTIYCYGPSTVVIADNRATAWATKLECKYKVH